VQAETKVLYSRPYPSGLTRVSINAELFGDTFFSSKIVLDLLKITEKLI
jgi:hypothetical protein